MPTDQDSPYTINFAGAQPTVFDVDDLMFQAHEAGEIRPVLAMSPDIRRDLLHDLLQLRARPEIPEEYEAVEIRHLTTRWGSVALVVDPDLPPYSLVLRKS